MPSEQEVNDWVADGLLRQVKRCGERHDEAREAFHESIRRASEYASQRLIGEAAGLSATRVNQIIHGRNR